MIRELPTLMSPFGSDITAMPAMVGVTPPPPARGPGAAPVPLSPMSTVNMPTTIVLGGPTASRIVSPTRQAHKLLMRTVGLPLITTPGPCGGIGKGVVQAWISAPAAAAEIAALIAAWHVALVVSSAALAAGAPGVPAAAKVAASAT